MLFFSRKVFLLLSPFFICIGVSIKQSIVQLLIEDRVRNTNKRDFHTTFLHFTLKEATERYLVHLPGGPADLN
jgi:hypothetical protein